MILVPTKEEHMNDKQDVIDRAKKQLEAGCVHRDDVYHAVVRAAARNGWDRYEMWRLVQGAE